MSEISDISEICEELSGKCEVIAEVGEKIHPIGRVYKMTGGGLVYIGSTKSTLAQRLREHKSDFKRHQNGTKAYISSFELFQGEGGVIIELLEEYTDISKAELHKRERYFIENSECVNAAIPYRSEAEHIQMDKLRSKAYREENKEHLAEKTKEYQKLNRVHIAETKKEYQKLNRVHIAEKAKEYQQVHRVHIAAQAKEYQQLNKVHIAEKAKEYQQLNKIILAQKKKEYNELNKLKVAERQHSYAQLNKVTIAEKKKAYYELNKAKIDEKAAQKVTCEMCKCDITKSSVRRHEKTVKHITNNNTYNITNLTINTVAK